MIRQQINLYQERFHEKQLLLSARNGLLVVSLGLALMLIASFFYVHMKQQQHDRYEQNVASKEQANQRLQAIQVELQRLLADDRIDRELVRLEGDLSARQRMIDFVENNQFGSGDGFSIHLTALAGLKKDDLWLHEMSLASDYIKLSGSALAEQSVPEYFNMFQDQQLFAGRVFDVFELGRDRDQTWKVDFVIASRALSND